ncbi:amino acid--[acyl-carrier-protein] ligase [Xylophilus sp. GOD-11R]|uniref:amino acid--[acyl-carrier-protein] ligase n=1 Tax=Xylophilus sp. GOD-11R TaxID=3089814 RepID=UPI00298C861D|nr:amino acid--[acyl-carrier-protein] ligase [Xylophilus sp. GOD-11R]WPB56640.1 amino acid--[acyl-carrier-protein] ligase [Xylophilus sp. GOD-11R]
MQYDSKSLYDGLVAHGLIVPSGEPGVFGRNAVFEDVLERFNALVGRVAEADGAEKFTFPPTLARGVFEKSGYMKSFPQLAMGVVSFCGCASDHPKLVQRIADGESYDDLMARTGVVLIPAACYPVYPSFTGTLPAGGRLVDMTHWVFRHEPSDEPTRMQAFRVREFVRVGSPDEVLAWRDMWLQRGLDLLRSLGLPANEEVATDPFFGRVGKILANAQREQKLKFEVVVPVISEEKPTAVCSFNYHQDYFSSTFEIRQSTGELAQTACLGFGLERVCMALFKHHGFDPAAWPEDVRAQLWT